MAKSGQRKRLKCGEYFDPDCRNVERQRYCSKPESRRARKAASQAAWLAKPQNVDYFCGPTQVVRVQAWRAAHPGYSRVRCKVSAALQDDIDQIKVRLVQLGTDITYRSHNHEDCQSSAAL